MASSAAVPMPARRLVSGEPDYKYGTGKLIMRVTLIGGSTRAADGEWLDLDGFELRADGSQLGPAPRRASVRVSRRHPGGGRVYSLAARRAAAWIVPAEVTPGPVAEAPARFAVLLNGIATWAGPTVGDGARDDVIVAAKYLLDPVSGA